MEKATTSLPLHGEGLPTQKLGQLERVFGELRRWRQADSNPQQNGSRELRRDVPSSERVPELQQQVLSCGLRLQLGGVEFLWSDVRPVNTAQKCCGHKEAFLWRKALSEATNEKLQCRVSVLHLSFCWSHISSVEGSM